MEGNCGRKGLKLASIVCHVSVSFLCWWAYINRASPHQISFPAQWSFPVLSIPWREASWPTYSLEPVMSSSVFPVPPPPPPTFFANPLTWRSVQKTTLYILQQHKNINEPECVYSYVVLTCYRNCKPGSRVEFFLLCWRYFEECW